MRDSCSCYRRRRAPARASSTRPVDCAIWPTHPLTERSASHHPHYQQAVESSRHCMTQNIDCSTENGDADSAQSSHPKRSRPQARPASPFLELAIDCSQSTNLKSTYSYPSRFDKQNSI